MPVFLTGDLAGAKIAEAALRIEKPLYPLAPGERAELRVLSPPGGKRSVSFSSELPLELLPQPPGQRDRFEFRVRPDARPARGSVVMRLFGARNEELASAGETIEVVAPTSLSLGAPAAVAAGLTLPLAIANTRAVRLEGVRLQTESAPGLRVTGAPERVTLKPSERLVIPLQATCDQSVPGRGWPLTVRVMTAGGAEVSETFRPGLWNVPRAPAPPVIDGRGAAWADIPAAVLGGDAGDFTALREGARRGPEDLSARARLTWDERALYVLVEVTDDQHVQSHHGPDVWQSDNVQLAFDSGLEAWKAREAGQAAEYAEIGLSRTDTGDEVYRWLWKEGPAPGVAIKSSREGNRTTYEAVIPWPELNAAAPKPGALSGFALIVNEDDGEGRDGWLQLYDGIGFGKDPRKFGVLKFAG
jgi:hypothetical protein